MRGKESTEARIDKARRGVIGGQQNQQVERAVATYLQRALGPTLRELPILFEKVETLNGDRQRNFQGAAVKRSDMAALNDIKEPLSAEAAGANPTKAEFDELVQDVHRIRDALESVAKLINKVG